MEICLYWCMVSSVETVGLFTPVNKTKTYVTNEDDNHTQPDSVTQINSPIVPEPTLYRLVQ